MLNKIKKWVKNEESQLTSETGMLVALVVIVALVLGPIVWPKISSGFTSIMDRFVNAAKNPDVESWK